METDVQGQKSIGIAVAAISAIYVYFLVFIFPFTPIFSETDQLIFIYEGSRLLHGDVMYRDFFQFTFPGSQTYYYAVLSVFGERYWLLPVTVTVLASVLAFLCLKISNTIISGHIRFIPPFIFLFFGFRWFGLDGSHRMFSPVFMLAAVLIILSGTDRKRLIVAGIFCALASFFTQQRGMIVVFAVAVFLILNALMTHRNKMMVVRDIVILAAAFLISLGLLCLYFIASAGPTVFFDSTFIFPAKYYKYIEATAMVSFLI